MLEKLQRLSEIAPGVCRYEDEIYYIGEYRFYNSAAEGFMARYIKSPWITGRPALDWLEGALRGVIEGKGWHYRIERWSWGYEIKLTTPKRYHKSDKTTAEALLAALCEAMEER